MPSVHKDWRRLPAQFRKYIEKRLAELKINPLPAGCRLLQGHDHYYRIRVGDYRIIYELKTEVRIVSIIRIRDRKDAYRGL